MSHNNEILNTNKPVSESSTLDNKFKEWKLILTDSSDKTRLSSNGIWGSMLILLLNLFRYQLFEALYIKSSSIYINPIIKRAFQDNYIVTQSIGIRRMLIKSKNEDKQDNSLAKLWNDIRQQTFDKDNLYQIYLSYIDSNLNKNPNIQNGLKLELLKYINSIIDDRNCKLKKYKKVDKIMLLDKNKTLKETYDDTNLFIAHAAQNYKQSNQSIKDTKEYISRLEIQTGELYKVYNVLRYFVFFNGSSAISYIESVINNDLTHNQSLTTDERKITINCWKDFKIKISDWEKESKDLLT